jgi:hypothetical protein
MGLLWCEVTTWKAWFDTRSWGNGDEPALGVSKVRSQASENKEGESARGKGVGVTVLTAGRWCSRRQLDEDGGAV